MPAIGIDFWKSGTPGKKWMMREHRLTTEMGIPFGQDFLGKESLFILPLSFWPYSNPDAAKYELCRPPSQASGILRRLQGPKPGRRDRQPGPLRDPEHRNPGLSGQSPSAPSPRPKPRPARTSGVAHCGKPRVRPLHAGNPATAPEVEPSRGFRRQWMRLHPSGARPPPPPQGGLVSRHPPPAGVPHRLGGVPAGTSPVT